jgi:hypothetical protein
MGEPEIKDPWKHYRDVYQAVPEKNRIGYAELQKRLRWGHRGRVKRAVSTLVGLEVLAWEGMRNGRAVSRGSRELDDALAAGLHPMPDREIATYPLLLAPVDDLITRWHTERGDPIDDRSEETGNDGVTVYPTWAIPAGVGSYTRPDLTAIVDLEFSHINSWQEVHAIEVKPYWSINRSALFEAIAQSSLQRCTFSWLIAWVPDPDSGHFTHAQKAQIHEAWAKVQTHDGDGGPLVAEAEKFGIGLGWIRDLGEDGFIHGVVEPKRMTIDPLAVNELFRYLRPVVEPA